MPLVMKYKGQHTRNTELLIKNKRFYSYLKKNLLNFIFFKIRASSSFFFHHVVIIYQISLEYSLVRKCWAPLTPRTTGTVPRYYYYYITHAQQQRRKSNKKKREKSKGNTASQYYNNFKKRR